MMIGTMNWRNELVTEIMMLFESGNIEIINTNEKVVFNRWDPFAMVDYKHIGDDDFLVAMFINGRLIMFNEAIPKAERMLYDEFKYSYRQERWIFAQEAEVMGEGHD